jgi:hypothetical protein
MSTPVNDLVRYRNINRRRDSHSIGYMSLMKKKEMEETRCQLHHLQKHDDASISKG